ncbi:MULTISPECIES: TetR/AcrR family transcriptional regulator [Streptomyces]|uniref:TetR/AcrR family transcriptional regulator n=1 Tax=Streptomyces TaxID=1883 RepID=UPI00093A2BD7|nr:MULTISPECIES: TetR/AcrR family transcriptional regulator [unclassified Streptomyces]OKJ06440.1 TetR family transcriptional regulator [Streptomyces sp. TSRI0261]QNQ35893.1 TetR/AcrR family transcriptional regulator [Streptomyces sp. CB00271]
MPEDEHPSAPPSLRQRRRAVATQEIVRAAELHIAEHGSAALSLRAVARSLGMSVQALYHYFPDRNALVTVLIAKAYEDLATAVQTAADTTPPDPPDPSVPRFVIAAEGYRQWAVAHPERFQLLYGTPLRSYAAPVGGPTTRAMQQMSAIFQRVLFGDFTTEQLAAADTLPLSPPFLAHLEQLSPDGLAALPPRATALLLSGWGHMHGLVVLEVFGHTSFLGGHQAEIFHLAMRDLVTDIHRRIPGGHGNGPG